jgi:DNA-binding MarR family transcriptional regulator
MISWKRNAILIGVPDRRLGVPVVEQKVEESYNRNQVQVPIIDDGERTSPFIENCDAVSDNMYHELKLENQLCFPLYACAREVVKRYAPYLNRLHLTYTQYIIMMVMWERKKLTVKELGEYLYLDSGTLTPVLKKMEDRGILSRTKGTHDGRNLHITLTKEGEDLKEEAVQIPGQMVGCIPLSAEEAASLYQLLYKILGGVTA